MNLSHETQKGLTAELFKRSTYICMMRIYVYGLMKLFLMIIMSREMFCLMLQSRRAGTSPQLLSEILKIMCETWQ